MIGQTLPIVHLYKLPSFLPLHQDDNQNVNIIGKRGFLVLQENTKDALHFALVSQSHSFIYLMRSSLILSCNYLSRSVFFLLFSPPQSPPLRQLCFLSPTIMCSGVYYRYFSLYLSPELQKSEGRKNDDLR